MDRPLRIALLILTLAASSVGRAVADCFLGDLDGNCEVNWTDLQVFAGHWLDEGCLAPNCEADLDGVPGVNIPDFVLLAENWRKDCDEATHIKWLGHASCRIWRGDVIIYVDPWKLNGSAKDATLVLVTHSHGDHYSPTDIAKVAGPETQLIAPADVIASQGWGQAITPGQTIELNGLRVTGVAAYNLTTTYHPKSRNWVGFAIEIGSARIYCAGDTDMTPEMQALTDIDVALLPVGGTYTMDAVEAAEATGYIEPELAVPYHWGDVVGSRSDAEQFAAMAQCDVRIMDAGETISSVDWLADCPLIAYWRLDETEGNIAYDIAGGNSGTVNGDPVWRPTDGKVDGALELDGADDYVATGFVLDPSEGPFSVFCWVKGGSAGQVIISQTEPGTGRSWLSTDAADGKLMTDLRAGGRFGYPLNSETIITGDHWRRVGFVWDGSYRHLYVDDTEVATDTSSVPGLESATGGLHFGTGSTRDLGSFWFGQIDDIRIYDLAMAP